MKLFKIIPYLLTIFLVTMLINGCAVFKTDLRTIDKLPDNVPKGYVELYTEENEDAIKLHKEFPGTFFIYKLKDGVETEIKGMVWSWRTRRRIAVQPGMHTFRVKFASADIKIIVEAFEGMIVPVKFTYNLGGSENYYQVGKGNVHKQYFNMVPSIEKAIPYNRESKK